MSTMATFATTSAVEDWGIVAGVLTLWFFVLYPCYLLLVRLKHTRRIKNQLVTSRYKLPTALTPAELSYIFSTRMSSQQLRGTLLDMANKSVVVLDKKTDGQIEVGVGPKIDKNLKTYEKILLAYVKQGGGRVPINRIIRGFTKYKPIGGGEIRGSREYVFWWVLRDHMRQQKLIRKHMSTTYAKMVLLFVCVWGLILAVLPLTFYHLLVMLDRGEIELGELAETAARGGMYWAMLFPLLLVVGFFSLRLRGKMLGRSWLLSDQMRRYLPQFEAYREFVRLTHKKKLRFESKELEKEARASTRPYAVVFGYVKE